MLNVNFIRENIMNFNKNQTAGEILPTLPKGMELRLKATQKATTAFIGGDANYVRLKTMVARTELDCLRNYGEKMNVYQGKPEKLANDINEARGVLDFWEACMKLKGKDNE